MKKALILVESKDKYFFPYIKSKEIEVVNLFDSDSIKNNFLFKVFRKLHLPLNVFYGSWKKNLKDYEKIIIFDWVFDDDIAKFFIRQKIAASKNVYCWNPIKENNVDITLLNKYKNDFNVYSYDKKNCEQYDLRYNSMTYTKEVDLEKSKPQFDIIFLGALKDRAMELNSLYNTLNEQHINLHFYVVGDKTNRQVDFEIYSDPLSYHQYLELIAKSKVILDIAQKDQSGMSLRVTESLFLKKKLVTNNVDIINYDLYSPNNVFIIGKDPINELKAFIEKDYDQTDHSLLINKYDIEQWVNNFV